MDSKYIIQARDITKTYGKLTVLHQVNIDVMEGEIVAITGASGAGKTTLLQIIGSLDSPNNGRVKVKDIDIFSLKSNDLAAFRNKHLGFVFQFHHLLPEFTALENVTIPAYIRGESKISAEKRAMEYMEFLNIGERSSHKPAELSGGEAQRVAIARALINQPAVVLADEPSGNLDAANSLELHDLFFKLRERYGQTFVIVTHDPILAQKSDRIIHLNDGLIIED